MGYDHRGKWSLFQALREEEKIIPYLPEIKLFSKSAFEAGLERYKRITIQPCFGSIGEELNIVTALGESQCDLRSKIITGSRNREQLFSYIKKNITKDNPYLIHHGNLSNQDDCEYKIIVVMHYSNDHAEWTFKLPTEINSIEGCDFELLHKIKTISLFTAGQLKKTNFNCRTILLTLDTDMKGKVRLKDVNINPYFSNKWVQYYLLSQNKELSPYLPDTGLMNDLEFCYMVNKYNQIMFKPCLGYWGKNIIQITGLGYELFELQTGKDKAAVTGEREVYRHLESGCQSKGARNFILQKKINLATIDKCPFDLRVMLQRKKTTDNWSLTGILAKVAYDGFFVTNMAKAVMTIENALKISSIKYINSIQIVNKLKQLCLKITLILESFTPDIKVIGYDMGIDQCGDVWFIEANFKPDYSVFYLLEDKTMYRTMMEYKAGK